MKSERSVSVERRIAASADEIFEVLTHPARHCEIDGSGSLVRVTSSDTRLSLGSTFSMKVRIGVSYGVKNRVLEFEEGRLIAWAHFAGQRWRYALAPQPDGATLVRETFDWSTARWPRSIERMGFPSRNKTSMEATLQRLADLVETSSDTDSAS